MLRFFLFFHGIYETVLAIGPFSVSFPQKQPSRLRRQCRKGRSEDKTADMRNFGISEKTLSILLTGRLDPGVYYCIKDIGQ